jgi:hypothetical protein
MDPVEVSPQHPPDPGEQDTRSRLEADLRRRCEGAAADVEVLAERGEAALHEDLGRSRVAAARLGEEVRRLLADPLGADIVIEELGPTFFVAEQGWRALFEALVAEGPEHPEHRLLALARYRRYLLARVAEILARLPAEPDAEPVTEPDPGPEADEAPVTNGLSLAPLEITHRGAEAGSSGAARSHRAPSWSLSPTPHREPPVPGGSVGDSPAPGEASPPSGASVSSIPEPERPVGRVRLPKGRTVRVQARVGEDVEIWLGRRHFRVEWRGGPVLVDDQGRARVLRLGRNLVGRSAESDVRVDPSYMDISRRHLYIDVREDAPFEITDLSRRGTYLTREQALRRP